jgi:polyhydroxyalkanoate synthesis regulator phasin
MLYDQERDAERQERFVEMEEGFSQIAKQNEGLKDKQMYYEDLLEKKDRDIHVKKSELAAANKKIQELNKQIEDIKNRRRSNSSMSLRNDTSSSIKTERKQRYIYS